MRVLVQRWRVVLTGLLLGIAAAVVLALVSTPMYSASVTIFVSARSAPGDATQAYQGNLLSQEEVKSYTELIASDRIRSDAGKRLGYPIGEGAVSASAEPDTVLITATATDASPVRAQQIATAVGSSFINLVTILEKPSDSAQSPAIEASVVQLPSVPSAPISPQVPLMVLIGTLVGLAVGYGGALLRNARDNSVKTIAEIQEVAGVPSLGVIVYDQDIAKHPVVVHNEPQSPLTEVYRSIRTNLQFIDVDRRSKIVVVTSAVPDEGKTTTLCNVAVALAQSGSSVLVIDADLRRPKVHERMGLEGAVGLTSVLAGSATLDQAIQPWAKQTMDILASGRIPPNPSELLASQRMAEVLDEVRGRYEFVLIDASPLLPVTDAVVLARQCDGVVLVVRQGRTKRTQVRDAVAALDVVGAKVLGAILSMAPKSSTSAAYHYVYRQGPSTRDSTSPAGSDTWPAGGTQTETLSGMHAPASSTNGQVRDLS